MGIIVFNGISSRDVGIEVETFPTYDIPEREYEAIHVTGRNGDVIIDNGTYKNVNRTYDVSIATYNIPYSQKMAGVAKWLHSAPGYTRLEDSYDPDFYRLAYYNEAVSIENLFNEAGKATINFVCKPQRFYKSGDMPVEFTTNGVIQNRTVNIALPKIIITTDNTASSITISGVTVSIAANSGTNIILDSELQDAYNSSGVNKNSVITLDDGMFPLLYSGSNEISLSGGVTKIEIIPRWWTI
jgi:phage-related protein